MLRKASALVTIAHERFATIASPFSTDNNKDAVTRRSLLFSVVCWLLGGSVAMVQVTLARDTITHDICTRAPVIVIKSLG